VRKNSLREDLYLQKDGTWGRYGTARRFDTQAEADAVCEATPDAGGIFACSVPRRLPARKRA